MPWDHQSMSSAPGSFDGAEGEVFDETGRRVAFVALDDQRTRRAGPSGQAGRVQGAVLGCFEEADPVWAARLPRASGPQTAEPLSVTIFLPGSGERFENVVVGSPRRGRPGPVHSLFFPLAHEGF
jgi:hypothetical protein